MMSGELERFDNAACKVAFSTGKFSTGSGVQQPKLRIEKRFLL